MAQQVFIPSIFKEDRIGSVFNLLFQIINSTNDSKETDIIWNFRYCSYLHPFALFALSVYKDNTDKNIVVSEISDSINTYLDYVRFQDNLSIENEITLKNVLEHYLNKTYIPICKFSRTNNNLERMQSVIENVIKSQIAKQRNISNVISYLVGELVSNIVEHSSCSNGYIFSQYLSSENTLNIGIADNGISIYGSFISRKKYLDIIKDSEAKAIQLATKGFSTKNRPDAENRGYGISTSKRLVVEGSKGGFFIMSGGAFHRQDNIEGGQYIDLPATLSWEGTIILIKIDLSHIKDLDFTQFLES